MKRETPTRLATSIISQRELLLVNSTQKLRLEDRRHRGKRTTAAKNMIDRIKMNEIRRAARRPVQKNQLAQALLITRKYLILCI